MGDAYTSDIAVLRYVRWARPRSLSLFFRNEQMSTIVWSVIVSQSVRYFHKTPNRILPRDWGGNNCIICSYKIFLLSCFSDADLVTIASALSMRRKHIDFEEQKPLNAHRGKQLSQLLT